MLAFHSHFTQKTSYIKALRALFTNRCEFDDGKARYQDKYVGYMSLM